MAKSTFQLFDGYHIGGSDINNAFLVDGNAKGFYGIDTQSLNEFHVKGKGLDYELGRPSDGVITTIDVFDESGVKALSITNLNIDAGLIGGASLAQFLSNIITNISIRGYNYIGGSGDDNIYTSIGNDVIKAGLGDDSIGGGKGNDKLWGGEGEDSFGFFTGYGKDKIMDFDADGSDGSQDLLNAVVPTEEQISKVGKNTVIDYGNGDVLTLVGIDPEDIDSTDFL